MTTQSSMSSTSSSPDVSGSGLGLAPLVMGTRGKKTRHPGMSPQMATFALNPRQAKRTSTKKVKTGCITCKRRRVKCDETRPFCLKCTKSSRGPGVCEGYAADRVHHRRPADQPRTIAKGGTWRIKPSCCSNNNSNSNTNPLLEPGYEANFFTDAGERSYFDFWRALVSNIYLFPNDTLVRVLPQLARTEPAIKHAALAVAAMARALVPSVRRRTRREFYGNGPHYEFALKHYVKAIKLLRTAKPSADNMLWAIVCCVLFVTFECLQCDYDATLAHVDHAYRMMEQYFRHQEQEPLRATSSIREVCDDAAWVFQGMTMQSWSHNALHSKNLAEISWCCRGKRRALAVEEMPAVFDDLHMARRWWRVVQHYTCHRCPIYTDVCAEDPLRELSIASCMRSSPLPDDAEELLAVLPEFLGHLQRWGNAFQGLFLYHRANKERDSDSYVETCNLRVQYLILWTDVTSLSYRDDDTLRRLTPIFREIVALSRFILREQGNCGGCSEVFSMDNGPTLSLLTVACRCRDAGVRKEATDLLGKYHRRDGLWDSRTFHAIAVSNSKSETFQSRPTCHVVVDVSLT
ncbi:Transcriptional regulatory protein moc3 [Colletotrichum orbiculare MAFF 240422]|uniref:Transcriptional regulatory protein moc3 n=1 Tax=Colletotrichum orbiculare (strain 104-T / ATCC 96160 / CBS 514.97 / LARS 414 / MAFF 240422) TaxID=1213857 RepID=N4V9D7_COLOR|nr:Transcriptional regulatory protein moc3 [Colletotrichum orbiculare MAFF 240422]